MSKTAPGPKELAQRAMQEARVTKGAAPKKRGLIPYAGKPKSASEIGYGRKPSLKAAKPGPKGPRKPKQ